MYILSTTQGEDGKIWNVKKRLTSPKSINNKFRLELIENRVFLYAQ